MTTEPSGVVRAKVVLVGAPGVGKTSLVRRFVHQAFSDRYRSTLGVKVDRKSVAVDDRVVHLLLWDTHGEGDGLQVPESYFAGASAALAVFDSTRPETLDTADSLAARIRDASPDAVVSFAANKSDLLGSAEHQPASSVAASPTSAKTGDGVEEIFGAIARQLAG